MRLHLPNSAFLGNIDPFLRSIDVSDTSDLKITANRKWISVHPVVLSMIASLGAEVGPENIEPIEIEARSKHYLERMGLYRALMIPEGMDIIEHDPTGRFIPLTNVRTSDELTGFLRDLVPLLHLEADQARSIRYIISELIRNVLEHSSSENGAFICAQYYRKSNTARIGIADRGVGIRETISRSHLAPSDLSAIRLALMPGITGLTRKEGGTETNAGAGLFFIKSIAAMNRDFFLIYSGKAMYKLLRSDAKRRGNVVKGDPFRNRHSSGEDLPYWRGTVVGMDISLDRTGEFTGLLDDIRGTYIRTMKERKRRRYRRPRFI